MSFLPPQDGQLERLRSLIAQSPASIDVRSPSSGDTPLILAAREGHAEVIKLLMRHGCDVTSQNDSDETALDVATPAIRKVILSEF